MLPYPRFNRNDRTQTSFHRLIGEYLDAFIKCAAIATISFIAANALAKDLEWRFPTDRITSQQWTQFRDEVLAKPNITRAEFANQLVITVNAEYAIYVFTQPGHPAHPAVVIRSVVANGSGSTIRRMGHFAGSEQAFAVWWKEFDPLDAAVQGRPR